MELNRSDRSEIFTDRELLEAVLQKPDDLQCSRLNESGGSRMSSIVLPPRPNGNLSRPSSFVSKRSVTLSQDKLSDHDGGASCLFEKGDNLHVNYNQIKTHLHVLSLTCICSLVIGTLAMQLLIALADIRTNANLNLAAGESGGESLVAHNNATYVDMTEVATALATFVVGLDVTCLLVCSLQCVVVAKLLRLYLGDERALKYLKDCSSSRFIAISGFYVSIPALILCVILYVVLRFSSTAAITATVILVVGVVFCLLSLVQNSYHWRIESMRAHDGLPVHDGITFGQNGHEVMAGKELSTLV